MYTITNRPIDSTNTNDGDDFFSMEGDYSNAKGDNKAKAPKEKREKTPRDTAERDKRRSEKRASKKEKREKDKVARRLDKSKTKLKPNAKPLEQKDKAGKGKVFVEKIKALFTRKNPKTGKDEYVAKDEKTGKENVIEPKDVEVKNKVAYSKEDIKEAIEDGAELVSDASGLIAEYSPEEVIAVDDENSDSSEYYKKSDVEGNWWTKQSTTIKLAVIGASVLFAGFVGYMIFKGKK